MSTPEADTLAQLIDDCTALPEELRPARQALPEPGAAAPWEVDDAHYAQVADLDAYV
ncbi:hypothetical protein [Saccharothrix syringae]|uniref:hypothetical protein n=1 Tax=Saccharothrix syringae TaxID=103733 RepID=UPI000AAB5044|nr:hypothetical protein [Saccharothrix syringae]